jgi:hypothetical protein
MTTSIDVFVSDTETEAKQAAGVVVAPRLFAENAVPANALPCGAQCPLCEQAGSSGSCVLEAGHTSQHQCNLVATHQWSSPGDIPGPHGS